MTSPDEFRNAVLHRFFEDMQAAEKDNYAWERFSFDGVDRSEVFNTDKHIRYLTWFCDRYADVFAAYCGLADDASRERIADVIRFRLAGHLHVRIGAHMRSLKQEADGFYKDFVMTASQVETEGMFGHLVRIAGDWNGNRYELDTTPLAFLYPTVYRQYFFERDGMIIRPELGDHIIDGGAFLGETACVFSHIAGPTGKVFAFDPVYEHVEVLRRNVHRSALENVEIIPAGLADRTVEAPPIRLGKYHPGWRAEEEQTPLCRLDDLLLDGRLTRLDFIKLDVEGSEMATLRGAVETLRRFRPKLALSIYHRPNDLFEVQQFVNDLQLGYRFYIEHYTTWDEEIVLYGIAQ